MCCLAVIKQYIDYIDKLAVHLDTHKGAQDDLPPRSNELQKAEWIYFFFAEMYT